MSRDATSIATKDATPSNCGNALFSQFSAEMIAATTAVAVGAILGVLSTR